MTNTTTGISLDTILSNVQSFFHAVFAPVGDSTYAAGGFATQLVVWVSNTPLAQIGLIMWVLVSCAGVARRFIPGI